MGGVKTVVTKHLRKMLRSHMHKAAERNTAARISSDKINETNSLCFQNLLLLGQAAIS